jgi:hypothetical protein
MNLWAKREMFTENREERLSECDGMTVLDYRPLYILVGYAKF